MSSGFSCMMKRICKGETDREDQNKRGTQLPTLRAATYVCDLPHPSQRPTRPDISESAVLCHNPSRVSGSFLSHHCVLHMVEERRLCCGLAVYMERHIVDLAYCVLLFSVD